MNLFCFASRNDHNIRAGFAAKRWAVATVSDSASKSRLGKARKYFSPGDKGLLYSNTRHGFTVPFIVRSHVQPDEVVSDIWPEPWVFPFDIEPLGRPDLYVPGDLAREKWPLFDRIPWKGSISASLNFTGTTVFVPTKITDGEWSAILDDLADKT